MVVVVVVVGLGVGLAVALVVAGVGVVVVVGIVDVRHGLTVIHLTTVGIAMAMAIVASKLWPQRQ